MPPCFLSEQPVESLRITITITITIRKRLQQGSNRYGTPPSPTPAAHRRVRHRAGGRGRARLSLPHLAGRAAAAGLWRGAAPHAGAGDPDLERRRGAGRLSGSP